MQIVIVETQLFKKVNNRILTLTLAAWHGRRQGKWNAGCHKLNLSALYFFNENWLIFKRNFGSYASLTSYFTVFETHNKIYFGFRELTLFCPLYKLNLCVHCSSQLQMHSFHLYRLRLGQCICLNGPEVIWQHLCVLFCKQT